ncbi:NfeD family protein [Oscillospiraceae bacterium 21-37]|uniref:NfeD family protein n=1 Tax=Eubacteriales TaxID=186802 RepID=UPI001371296C|nr:MULTISPECIES: NfeD family protein [unclassified Neglectibacter]NBI17065.1 NfeD family protein [Neglectibacter sp. 59]NBJ72477.1 NfeD family protein [Neglectibacter sp. X4]NCE80252.1 NfeD family protein [Neglectibacter sp. X58]
MMTGIWLGITIVAAVVEAAVPALVSIWFVPGGLAALICALAGGAVWLQIALFLALSCLALVFTRPLAKRLQKPEPVGTNADRVLGAQGVVTEDIDNLLAQGRVSVLGNSWAARSARPQEKIPAGEQVTVERIEGVKLIVAPKE